MVERKWTRDCSDGEPQPVRVSVQISMSESENDNRTPRGGVLIALAIAFAIIMAGWIVFLAYLGWRLLSWAFG